MSAYTSTCEKCGRTVRAVSQDDRSPIATQRYALLAYVSGDLRWVHGRDIAKCPQGGAHAADC